MSTYTINAAKHVTPEFLPLFQKATGDAFVTGEVFDKSMERICGYQDHLTNAPNYPTYFSILYAFTRGNTSSLPDQVEIMKHNCRDLAKNVIAFTILCDGTPMVYQGREQHFSGAHDPDNREALWLSDYDTNTPLYELIATLNTLRKHASPVDPEYLNTQASPILKGLGEMAFVK
ncbi:glycoside hydrolase superfamily [Aspergillus pseudotamarii]|uniref:Glycoside hydrolase superfamily n=1 Tax=Aspergillus pseudotamarii TaxID=132259 RepID=A0A5N6SEB7_ASPPS|nr:glycoside hydrolase superfamily [Aspergillus pseudotamarii]KAE8133066.1 glycoside hydrolase superfamily [Aspergillus pseudotamarii]